MAPAFGTREVPDDVRCGGPDGHRLLNDPSKAWRGRSPCWAARATRDLRAALGRAPTYRDGVMYLSRMVFSGGIASLRGSALVVALSIGTSCGQTAHRATTSPQAASAVDAAGDWLVHWDRTTSGWKPPIFNGTLHLERSNGEWSGQLHFQESVATFSLESLRVDADRILISFRVAGMEDRAEVRVRTEGGRLVGDMRWSAVPWTPFGGERAATPSQTASEVDPAGDWEIHWDRTAAGWRPPLFDGTLHLQRNEGQWSGQLHFRQSQASFAFEALRLEADRATVTFRVGGGEDRAELRVKIQTGHLVGEMRWGVISWTPVSGDRVVVTNLHPGSVDHSLPAVDISRTTVDKAALSTLLANAAAEHSSAVVIVKDGKIGSESYRDGYDGSPLPAMSVSKSVVSMAVGCLIADGKLTLETRVASLFPEWSSDPAKAQITVRHLLTHTSGLDPLRAEWRSNETIRDHALKSKLAFSPGTNFQYNNNAVDFLAVVFKRASGVALDDYLEAHVFRKLDIVGAHWMKDSEGTPLGAGELIIRPVDLAKLGQLMLDGGQWQGERILPRDWVERSVAPSQSFQANYGLLWWREGTFSFMLTEQVLAAWRGAGVDAAGLTDARALLGHRYAARDDFTSALARLPAWGRISSVIAAGNRERGAVPWFFGARVVGAIPRGSSGHSCRGCADACDGSHGPAGRQGEGWRPGIRQGRRAIVLGRAGKRTSRTQS
jgi:CubicO group peptidase (beta-lactamase class C family)